MPDDYQATGPTWRERQKQQTHQIILEAAKELFDTLGYDKTTIRAVAKYAGVGVGTVMNHFKDKSALLSATLVGDWEQTEAEVWATLPQNATHTEQMLHVARVFYTYYLKRPSLSRNLLKTVLFSPESNTEELRRKDQEMREHTALRLKAAQEQRLIRPEVDCMLAARALFANYLYVLYWGLNQPAATVDQMMDMLSGLLEALMKGIAMPPEA